LTAKGQADLFDPRGTSMIIENRAFGIDLGIGSCGWSVLQGPEILDDPCTIEGMGSWIFDVPETDKERTPTNQIRRANRLLRRVIRRRRNRMQEIRRLFQTAGLTSSSAGDALALPDCDPWELRAKGLDKGLTGNEFAAALGHIAKRRGFKSAAKRKTENAASEDKKMLVALEKTQEKLSRYRTVGEMFARDPEFALRRRNRDGVYDRTGQRDDLAKEVDALFAAQRRFGQTHATAELQDDYIKIAFRQKPMQDSEKLVGFCPFERTEKRAAKLSPSFEKFRLLTRLINLRVTTPEGERALTPQEIARATANLGNSAKLSVTTVRKLIGLGDDQRFTTIKPDQEGDDIAARKGEAMSGTYTLRKALGDELWATAQQKPEQLDAIAHVLSFFESNDSIAKELRALNLDEDMLSALTLALEASKFAKFKGAAHISAKAVRNLMPHLLDGKRYDEACTMVRYNHAASSLSHVDHVKDKASFNALVAEVGENIANPIARKALTEGLKQLWAMRNKYGLPGAIYIELARDVGNSLEKRNEIKKGIDDATAQREKERQEARDLLSIEDINGDTLLRYRLWKEQGGRCLYTDQSIPPDKIIAGDNSLQVDHILPWSRFGDDSYNNKTLCFASANQRKKNATPYEWMMRDTNQSGWDKFLEVIESNKALRGFKKRNYLLKNAKEAEEKFRSRNLNDTRYACRLLAEAVKLFYPRGDRQEKGGTRRVFTRPGGLTSALRQAWGLESLKKVDGKRLPDDRHHALDAVVVAAVSEGEVAKLTKSFQEWEQAGLGRPLRKVAEPWTGFRQQVEKAYANVFVARPERRRAKGEGHAATIRQVEIRDGEQSVFERVAVKQLGIDKNKFSEIKAQGQLERLKDPERNQAILDAITTWIANGRPMDEDKLPRSPRGDIITKIRLLARNKPAVPVRGGTADRGEMVRVDVFSMPNKKGKNAGKNQWFMVPVYPHQVMNKKDWPQPPMRAVAAGKDEADWFEMTAEHVFRFSLYPRSYVEVVKSDGEVLKGYFGGLHRGTGAINLFNHHNPKLTENGIGAKTLLTITKYAVDRFGNKFKVGDEVRTWHGEACTSPSLPG
jgi:CRISPR-associated endonuclease Csn1